MTLQVLALTWFGFVLASGSTQVWANAAKGNVETEPSLIATLDIDRTTAYVNEQVLLTLTFAAPTIAFNVTSDDLSLTDSELVSLHQQKSTETINNRPYQLIKKVYALYPYEPGIVTIPAVTVRAVLPVGSAGNTSGTNPVITAATKQKQIHVKPAPQSSATWFPAQSVALNTHWSSSTVEDTHYAPGDLIVRHIRISLTGQHPAAIPEISLDAPQHLRLYPEQPVMHSTTTATGLTGERVMTTTYVASRPGSYELPPVSLDWWDIEQKAWRTSTLPAEVLNIVGADSNSPTITDHETRYRTMTSVLAVLCILLGLTSGLLWYRLRRVRASTPVERAPRGNAVPNTRPATERAAWAVLKRTLEKKEPAVTRRAIINWARFLWPNNTIRQLDQVINLAGSTSAGNHRSVQDFLIQLDEQLYRSGENVGEPDYRRLLRQLGKLRKQARRGRQSTQNSSTLYPAPR